MENEYKAIFELNSKSPLFARVAADTIKEHEFEKAISILEAGIDMFENYPTPYFLLGDLLIKLGKNEEARSAFESGNKLLNNSDTFSYYQNLITEETSEVVEFETHQTEDITSEVESIVESGGNFEEEQVVEQTTDEDDLVELADKLKTAKIEINHDEDFPIEVNESKENEEFKPLKGLVSETLASIYFNQSNYKEAKAIYETLIEIQPEREDYFNNKLAEIELKMKTRKSEDE
jgi:tetratricopeptide (TPR) repeat protein